MKKLTMLMCFAVLAGCGDQPSSNAFSQEPSGTTDNWVKIGSIDTHGQELTTGQGFVLLSSILRAGMEGVEIVSFCSTGPVDCDAEKHTASEE